MEMQRTLFEQLADFKSRAAAEGLVEAYDSMASIFMRLEALKALCKLDGVSDADVFQVRATITHIQTDKRAMWYIACPTCKKKVQGASDDTTLDGFCEKCNAQVTGSRRWLLGANCYDATGNRFISFFDDTALKLLEGKTADEMARVKAEEPTGRFEHALQANLPKTFRFKCKAKSEVYQEEARMKVNCIALEPVDFVEEDRMWFAEAHRTSASLEDLPEVGGGAHVGGVHLDHLVSRLLQVRGCR